MGRLIVFDGPEGAGKSDTINYLRDRFRGKPFLFTREPGGTQSGAAIRSICLDTKYKLHNKTIMLLMLADRHQHQEETIIPWLENQTNVITDRYASSTYAIQGYAHDNLGMVTDIMNNFYLKVYAPDIFIHLDVEAEVGLKRSFSHAEEVGKQNELRFEKEGIEFFNKVRKGFDMYAENFLSNTTYKKNYLKINTTNEVPDYVRATVYNFIMARV